MEENVSATTGWHFAIDQPFEHHVLDCAACESMPRISKSIVVTQNIDQKEGIQMEKSCSLMIYVNQYIF